MKKMQLVNVGKGLNRSEMKQVNGGYPGAPGYPNYPGYCQGVWVDCLCMGETGPYICKRCATLGSGQC